MTLPEFLERLEHKAAEAEAIGATAPVAGVFRYVVEELRGIQDVEGHGTKADAALSSPATAPREAGAGRVHLLDAATVAARLGTSKRWVYANADEWPFTRRVGRLVRFEAEGFERWLRRAQ
jgi:hypothetical protein